MAVTGVLKKCADCGTVFVAENPASKYCPCCSARRNIPGPARGNGYRKPPPDALTLDVRAADAAGLSYGVWRAREDDRKRKAKETIRRQIEERKKKHASHYSQHLYGKAADIWIAGVSVDTLAAYVETLLPNRGGIGRYYNDNFVHVDVRTAKSRWKG